MAVRVRIDGAPLDASPELSLFDCAEALDVPITNSCYKQGTCRECLVEVLEGMELLIPRTAEETHLRGNYRLACRTRIRAGSGEVRLRPLRRGDVRILDSGSALPALHGEVPLDPAVIRDGDDILVDGSPVDRTNGPPHGLAIDVGTTTVVVRLLDLDSGSVCATQAFENPQCFAGSDIMARIAYTADDDEARLRGTLIAYVNQAILALTDQPAAVYEVVVVGNPTMRDLFFGLDVSPLGQSPYRSLTEHELVAHRRTTTSLSTPARQLGLATHPAARAYALPLVGGHVGADAAAGLLAIDAAHEDRLVALMDIGTNTEIVVGHRGRMLAASCPAGPAFEGGTLSCGMAAFPGAIESVRLDASGHAHCRVIGDGPPRGICGSGLVDTLGELLRSGRMNVLGRIGADRFVLDPTADVYLSEADIARLAQAKAAQAAGWRLIMKAYGADFADIERLYLAGGFASHLDLESAQRIGLIPPVPLDRIRQVGNSAIEGATLALRSLKLRRALDSFVRTIEHVELETDVDFFDAFVEGCQFKPLGSPHARETS